MSVVAGTYRLLAYDRDSDLTRLRQTYNPQQHCQLRGDDVHTANDVTAHTVTHPRHYSAGVEDALIDILRMTAHQLNDIIGLQSPLNHLLVTPRGGGGSGGERGEEEGVNDVRDKEILAAVRQA